MALAEKFYPELPEKSETPGDEEGFITLREFLELQAAGKILPIEHEPRRRSESAPERVRISDVEGAARVLEEKHPEAPFRFLREEERKRNGRKGRAWIFFRTDTAKSPFRRADEYVVFEDGSSEKEKS